MSISRVSFTARGGDGGAGGGGGVGERALSTPVILLVRILLVHLSVKLTVINVSVMCDDLLDNRRPDLWL